jgi:F0F1-type ATP synthase membrane subunit b/b'
MNRHLIACIASVAFLASCTPSAAEQKAKADQAQQVANTKIEQANNEALQKGQAAQKEADSKIAQANAQTQEEAAKAQVAANQNIRQANDQTLKVRNDYQVETSKSVSQIDNRLDSLKVKALTSKPKTRAQFDSMMPKVAAQRSTVGEDLASLPSQTAQTFNSYKVKTDKDVSDLRKSVEEVAVNL